MTVTVKIMLEESAFIMLLFMAVLFILNVEGQYRDNYRLDSRSRYRYDWQPRHRPVSYRDGGRHQRTHIEKDHNVNRRYESGRPIPPPFERDDHLEYRETSYGIDPLRELDPYARRAVENSYRHYNTKHTERNYYRAEEKNQEKGRDYQGERRYKHEEKAANEETGGSGVDDCAMMKVSQQFWCLYMILNIGGAVGNSLKAKREMLW